MRYCDFMLTQCGRAYTERALSETWQPGVHTATVEFLGFASHVNLASEQGQFSERTLVGRGRGKKKKRRVRKGKRLNLPPPVKHSGEWQDSIHCKWKTAMKSERGRLARAVKPLLYLMLLKVDPSLAFDWQQIVSKPNCVGHNFQLGKRVRERYLSSLPDRPSEDNFNPKKKKRGDTGGWVSKVYFQKITEVWKSGKSRCLKRFICIKQSGPPLVIKNSKQQHLWMH